MEMGMPAKISKENMGLVDYWNRELKENPCLIDAKMCIRDRTRLLNWTSMCRALIFQGW